MKQTEPDKYTVNYDIESLIEIYKKKMILKWVQENHPERIIEFEKIIKSLLEPVDDEE
jgi:hypothetical protein